MISEVQLKLSANHWESRFRFINCEVFSFSLQRVILDEFSCQVLFLGCFQVAHKSADFWVHPENLKNIFLKRDIIKKLPKKKMFLQHTAWINSPISNPTYLRSSTKLAQ